jgi:hypothetical protein
MTVRLALMSGILALAAAVPARAQEPADPDEPRRSPVREPRVEILIPRYRDFSRLDQNRWRFHAPRFRVEPRMRIRAPRLREFAWEDAVRRRAEVREELRFRMRDQVERLRDAHLDRSEQVRRRAEALSERMLDRQMERSGEVRRRLEDRMRELEDRVRARRDWYRSI